MIKDTVSQNKKSPALTSDRWHVVHARWSGESSDHPRFVRSIESEHADRAAAAIAAKDLASTLGAEMAARPRATRDQILVRRPGFKSLKNAKRVVRRRK